MARRHLLQFRNAYVARPKYRVTCARLPGGADAQMVGALLSQPGAANWTSLLVTFCGSTTVHMAKRPPPGRGSWFHATRDKGERLEPGPRERRGRARGGRGMHGGVGGGGEAGGISDPTVQTRLLPLDACDSRCGSLGACIANSGDGLPACLCFPPALSISGSCAVADTAHMPRPSEAARARARWAARRQRWRQRFSHEGLICPAGCSDVGACDGEGFCRCPAGRWGLDCALGLDARGQPAVLAARASDAGAAEAGAWPRVYVHDVPPLLRLGEAAYEAGFDYDLSSRMLAHPARAPTPESADFYWIIGPSATGNLVDKLHYARSSFPDWNASFAAGEARHIAMLFSERGPGDSFEYDELLADASATAYGADLNPASESRAWLILTHNGIADTRLAWPWRRNAVDLSSPKVRRCVNCFQAGKDIVLPFQPRTTDVPSCDAIRGIATVTSDGAEAPGQRHTLFFYAGRIQPSLEHAKFLTYYEGSGTPNVRTALLAHTGEAGFKIVNTFNKSVTRVSSHDWMRASHFCWVPPGQRYGDARRHIVSVFTGCIPVITIPDNHNTLEELLPWERFAVLVPPEQLPRLPQLLRSISPQRREEMRAALRCVWRRLWYSSVYGPCFGESASTDAFDGLLRVLAARVAPSGVSCGEAPRVRTLQTWTRASRAAESETLRRCEFTSRETWYTTLFDR